MTRWKGFIALCGLGVLSTTCVGSRSAPHNAEQQTPGDSPATLPRALALASTGLALEWSDPLRLKKTCEARLGRIRALRDAVKAAGPRHVLKVDDTMRREIDRTGGLVGLLAEVHPEAAVRSAAEECERQLKTLGSEISLDREVYNALAATSTTGLDPAGRRALTRTLRVFKRAGVDRDEATRKRLKVLSDRMVRLTQDFSRAIREDAKTLKVDPEDLEGLPADFVAAHPKGDDGKVLLTTNYPDFFPVQQYAIREAVRRDLVTLYLNRAYPANEENLRTLLRLRREYANILGYKNWADYDAAEKMTKTSATIESFIRDLQKIVRPRSDADLGVLLARKRKDDPKATRIEVWDRFFYVDRVQAEQYAFDARSVRPYFEYDRVTKGLMALYGQLFGVRFEPDPAAPVWHPSVSAFRLFAGEQLIGKFFLDMHPRAGKYGHAAMFPIQTGLSDGQLAIASLVCNFPAPSEAQPALMEHQQVVTYFHEFGHLIHHLLATGSAYVNLAGISTEWDFVEAPSQLLEEWAWDPDVLATFARHHETNEPIGADVVERLRRSAEFGKGVHVQRQLYYTALSFFLHTADPDKLDLPAFERRMMQTYSPYPYTKDTHGYASFGHLGGYSSAYYTYQWSLVLAKDIFTRFEAEGLLNGTTAQEYRKAILLPGGARDAKKLVEDFLGRPSNLKAYRAWLAK